MFLHPIGVIQDLNTSGNEQLSRSGLFVEPPGARATQKGEYHTPHDKTNWVLTHNQPESVMEDKKHNPGLILGLRPANERRRYFVTTSLIGWAQT